MRIFKIKHDSNYVPRLIPIVNKYYNFNCEAKRSIWVPYEVYNSDPKIKVKNFYSLGTYSALMFDEYALEVCRTVFEMAGEILPIKVEREKELYLLNVLECMNGLDYEKTIWDYYNDGTKGRILKFGFRPERVINEASIFKIPEENSADIFCYSDVKDPEDEFYHIYHQHKLTGLIFEEVYNSENY